MCLSHFRACETTPNTRAQLVLYGIVAVATAHTSYISRNRTGYIIRQQMGFFKREIWPFVLPPPPSPLKSSFFSLASVIFPLSLFAGS